MTELSTVFRSAGHGKEITISAQSLEKAAYLLESEGCADEGNSEIFVRSPQHLEKCEKQDKDSSVSSAFIGFCSAGRGDAIQVSAQSLENAARMMECPGDAGLPDNVECSDSVRRMNGRRPVWHGNRPIDSKTSRCSTNTIKISAQSLKNAAQILEYGNDSRSLDATDVVCTDVANRENVRQPLSCPSRVDQMDIDASTNADTTGFRSAGRGDAIQVSAQSLERAARIMDCRGDSSTVDGSDPGCDDAPSRKNSSHRFSCRDTEGQIGMETSLGTGVIGFCSAGRGDAIKVSAQSLEIASRIVDSNNDSEDTTHHVKNMRPFSCLPLNEQMVMKSSTNPSSIVFRSAGNGDAIKVSAKSLAKASRIMECAKQVGHLECVNGRCSDLPSREDGSCALHYRNGYELAGMNTSRICDFTMLRSTDVIDTIHVSTPKLETAPHKLDEEECAKGLALSDARSSESMMHVSKKSSPDEVFPASNSFSYIGYSQETVLSTEYLEKENRIPENKTLDRFTDPSCQKCSPSCEPFVCDSEGRFEHSSLDRDFLTPEVKQARNDAVTALSIHAKTKEPPNSCRSSFSSSRLLNQYHSPGKDGTGILKEVTDALPPTCGIDLQNVQHSGDPMESTESPCFFSLSVENEHCVDCTTRKAPRPMTKIASRVSFSSSCSNQHINEKSLPSVSIRNRLMPHENSTEDTIHAVTPSALKDLPSGVSAGTFVTPSFSGKIDEFSVSKYLPNMSFGEAISKGVMVTNASECLRLGVLPFTLEVSSTNAHRLLFCRESRRPASFAVDVSHVPLDLIGGLTDYKMSLKSLQCDIRLLCDIWYKNHLRWIIWKLASIERSFARYLGGNYLTYDAVVHQLRHRYEKEICSGARPMIRKILNRDVSSSGMMIVCVARISYNECPQEDIGRMGNQISRYIVEITDGWYSMPAFPDAILCEFIEKQKIQTGTKLLISNATISGFEEGMDPLDSSFDSFDPKKSPVLHLRANSTRLARWNSKLGFVSTYRTIGSEGMLRIRTISDVFDGGGRIPLIDVKVVKTFPLCFFDRTGKTRILSEAEEAAKIELYENEKQKAMEEFLEEITASYLKVRLKHIPIVERVFHVYEHVLTNNLRRVCLYL
jgi:BRCA2, oligonucleotide/oligosaccharide-binding, domain 1/BRCA2, helical